MKLRLRQYNQGWIVEYGKPILFGLWTKWVPVTTWAGLLKPYYYSTQEMALQEALSELKQNIIREYNYLR